MPADVATAAGVSQTICVDVSDAIAHCSPPIVTEADTEESLASCPRNSKPAPLTVSSVPPPAEPAAGDTEVMATWYVKPTPLATAAEPRVGRWTATAAVPGAPLPNTQLMLVASPSSASLVDTLPQATPPRLTSGDMPPSNASMTSVTAVPAWPVAGWMAWTTLAASKAKGVAEPSSLSA